MPITDILPFRTACSLCLTKNVFKLHRSKKGEPYYRCESCRAIVFLHSPLQCACFAIVHEGLASKPLEKARETAVAVVESVCRTVLRTSPVDNGVLRSMTDAAVKEQARQEGA